MASKITSSPATGEPITHTEAKRPLMSLKLLKAAINGDETYLKKFLGQNNNEPHMEITAEDVVPMETEDCLRSIAGMEDTILHILSANGHQSLLFTICTKDITLLEVCNARNETPFHHAARFGHKNTILELIRCAQKNFDEAKMIKLLRQKNCIGETALHEAARHGHAAIVEVLMKQDVELACLVNDDSASPLFLATARGSLDVVKTMVKILSDHETTQAFYSGPKKQTALHAVVLQGPGNHDIAKLLLDKDRSLAYLQDSDGSFPVHTAVRMGHVKMIILLLQKCPDSSQLLDGKGRNFLHIAIEAKKLEIIFKFLKDSNNKLSKSHWKKMFNKMLDTIDNKGNTPLHLAAEHGYVTVRHSLLENNELDLILKNKDGQIAFDLSWTVQPSNHPIMSNKLLKAAIEGNTTVLNKLQKTGDGELLGTGKDGDSKKKNNVPAGDCCNCLENAKDGIQRTFRRWNNGKPEFVVQIKPYKSDCLRRVTGMKDTILHILSASGHDKLVLKICKKDSSLLKACNVRGDTPFHHTARFGHDKTICILPEQAEEKFGVAGLKELLGQKNCLGETTLHEDARHGHRDVVSTLMEKDVHLAGLVNNDSVSPLYLATARGLLNVVKTMVKILSGHETTPDYYSGPKKLTALHAAVLQLPELTEEVLKLYSEPLGNEIDETGRTPLHFVASTGNDDIAELLLDKDPSLAYIQDSDGSFPVHTAARMGHVKIVVLLLQRCLDSGDLLDGNGRNFLHIAMEAKKSDILKLLQNLRNKLPIPYWKKMLNKMANTMDNKGNTPLHLAAEHEYNAVLFYLLKNDTLDLTLQNKEGLIAPDVSVIQLRKYKGPAQKRDILGEFYIRNREDCFTTGFFEYYAKDQMSKTELTRGATQDDISTMEARGAQRSSESVNAKAQLLGLGSVLIATVTFSAAFTLPGGTNQDTGTPVLGRKYIFKAFVIADYFAFLLSCWCTMNIIHSLWASNADTMEKWVDDSMGSFTTAARSMFIALALGLYLVLAPIGITGAVILAFSLFLSFFMNNYFAFGQQCHGMILEMKILQHMPDAATGAKRGYLTIGGEVVHLLRAAYIPILLPYFVIFLFASFNDLKLQ